MEGDVDDGVSITELADRLTALESRVSKLKKEVRFDIDLHEGMLHDISYQVNGLVTEIDQISTRMENEMSFSDGEGSQN